MTATQATAPEGPREVAMPRIPLVVLSFGAFVIGTAELVVVGILDLIAADTGVSISTAGQLVTAYALGIAFGAPALSALTSRFGQRNVLVAALVAFMAGNVLAVVATSFDLLLVARVLTGALHGLFAGTALALAGSLVAPDRKGQALSMVIGGITVSTIFGVPAGTLIGQALGWQAALLAVIALAGWVLAATLLFIPKVKGQGGGMIGAQLRAAVAPRVAAMLAVGLVLFGGQFIAFTFLTPFLNEVTDISGGLVGAFLLAYGVAATAGTLLGGSGADRDASATLLIANSVLVGALLALYLVGATPILAALALAAWGVAGFAIAPAVQLRVITLAGSGGDVAATLGVSAINAGIASGSLIGGAVIASQGADGPVLGAVIACSLALPFTWASRFLSPPTPVDIDGIEEVDLNARGEARPPSLISQEARCS
ncbi:MAG: MFS transporter [Thermoleophilaceae bacterium]